MPLEIEKTLEILHLIADGNSYEQIMEDFPDITLTDIFRAAEDAISIIRRNENREVAMNEEKPLCSMTKSKLKYCRVRDQIRRSERYFRRPSVQTEILQISMAAYQQSIKRLFQYQRDGGCEQDTARAGVTGVQIRIMAS